MVEVIVGEPLMEHISEFDAIIVGTNCYQMMTNGFQYEIVHGYPYVQEANDSTRYGDISKVGTFVECKKEGNPNIQSMISLSLPLVSGPAFFASLRCLMSAVMNPAMRS